MAKSLQQFVDDKNGKKVDYDGAYGAQCVDLFRFYNKEVLDIPQPRGVEGAKDFWSNYDSDPILNTNFTKIKNTPDFIPKPGDVMIWNGYYGPWGHIAIITEANINNFIVLSQNDPINRETHLKEYTYAKVYGVLRPNNVETPPVEPVDNSTEDRLREERNSCNALRESLIIELQTEKDNFKDYRNHMGSFLREMVTILDPNTVIEIAEENLVKNLAKKVVQDHSNVTAELVKKEREWARIEKELEEENLKLETEVKSLKGELQILIKRVEQVETDVSNHKEKRVENATLGEWITNLLNIFKRK